MSYDFELKFDPDKRLPLIAALQEFDPALDVADMSSADIPLTFGPRQILLKQLLDKVVLLAFRIFVGQVTELTSTSTAIQISVFKTSAGIHVSLADSQNAASAVFEKAWGYLRVMHRVAAGIAFDRQMEKSIDLDRDFDSCFQTYCSIAQDTQSVFREFDR